MHLLILFFSLMIAAALPASAADLPSPGQPAPAFELESIRGGRVKMEDLHANGPVALVVLRGFPGYQCPFCQRQVADFAARAAAFTAIGVKVVFVYPGAVEKASEFFKSKAFPEEFELLLDPGLTLADAYGIRWEAPRETVYPSTFLLEKGGRVFFVKSARLHGGRTTSAEVLEVLPKKK
jgi:peroxiredoxin Q/BCP